METAVSENCANSFSYKRADNETPHWGIDILYTLQQTAKHLSEALIYSYLIRCNICTSETPQWGIHVLYTLHKNSETLRRGPDILYALQKTSETLQWGTWYTLYVSRDPRNSSGSHWYTLYTVTGYTLSLKHVTLLQRFEIFLSNRCIPCIM
jgi:hypothetical protein